MPDCLTFNESGSVFFHVTTRTHHCQGCPAQTQAPTRDSHTRVQRHNGNEVCPQPTIPCVPCVCEQIDRVGFTASSSLFGVASRQLLLFSPFIHFVFQLAIRCILASLSPLLQPFVASCSIHPFGSNFFLLYLYLLDRAVHFVPGPAIPVRHSLATTSWQPLQLPPWHGLGNGDSRVHPHWTKPSRQLVCGVSAFDELQTRQLFLTDSLYCVPRVSHRKFAAALHAGRRGFEHYHPTRSSHHYRFL